jgi:FolB domain-containing protein
MDKIIISNLIARGIIGVNQWERTTIQDISITMILFIDLEKAGISDNMEDTISYSDIAKKALTIAETKKRKTVEALANDLAQMCLEDIRVQRVVVKVEKPGAVRFAKSVGVEIERVQPQHQGH